MFLHARLEQQFEAGPTLQADARESPERRGNEAASGPRRRNSFSLGTVAGTSRLARALV
jgi:hypothetical protein